MGLRAFTSPPRRRLLQDLNCEVMSLGPTQCPRKGSLRTVDRQWIRGWKGGPEALS